MVGLENSMDIAESAKKIEKPVVDSAERERQTKFLKQLRARKPIKVKAAKPRKAKSKKVKKMTRAKESETYYCSVCGCEVMCTTSSKSPIVCCDEVMCVLY